MLSYNGGGADGVYAVALMLEDFSLGDQSFSSPLSKVGLQFIVYIASSSGQCDAKPFFTGATQQDSECVSIAVGSTYSVSLEAQHRDHSIR